MLTWEELIDLLMESPLYFTMTVRQRLTYLRWFSEHYLPLNC